MDIESVACDLQVAWEDFETEKDEDEAIKKQSYDEILESIKNLKLDQEIEAFGFGWGCTMISQKELDTLPEFDGW